MYSAIDKECGKQTYHYVSSKSGFSEIGALIIHHDHLLSLLVSATH